MYFDRLENLKGSNYGFFLEFKLVETSEVGTRGR